MNVQKVDVVIVGAGVTGAGLDYILAKYSSVRSVIMLEKNPGPAQVNSSPLNNAQTSHDGGTETNYSLEHALDVKAAAVALRRYVVARGALGLYSKTLRMALGVGTAEVELLRKRFEEFGPHYPDLSLIGPDELRFIEPKVMEGRDPNEPVAALVSSEGFAVNYQRLAECFIEDAAALNPQVEHKFNTKVEAVFRNDDEIVLITTGGNLYCARVVVFAAGPYSLKFAHDLGYGKEYAILAVAGDFYTAGPILKNKVYRVQQEGLPFAEMHGDPNVLDANVTRFGPTTKPVFVMERHRWETFGPYLSLGMASWSGFMAIVRILSRKGLLPYILENYLYKAPVVGKYLLLRKLQKMVPTLRIEDIEWHKNSGGLRPQIVNLVTGQLEMGEKIISGHNVFFETTPSPGASVCLRNAVHVAESVVRSLGDATLDRAAIASELGLSCV